MLNRFVSALVLFSAAAFGQASAINGEIVGTITDSAGAAIAGARLTVVSVGTGYTRTADTAVNGQYRFSLLPLGRYDIRAEFSGFAPVRQTGIEVSAGATVTQDIRLEVKGVTTEIVVSAISPVIDPSRTDTGRSLSSYIIANLPLVSRNPYNFILQQPNVTGRGNTEFGVPRKVNANGFNGRIN